MTRRPFIVLAVTLLALAAMACNLNLPGSGGDTTVDQQPAASAPEVSIRVPVNGMSFAEGTTVVIQVVGTDSGAGVSMLELLIDDRPFSSMPAPNTAGQGALMANFSWSAQGVGAHSITAIARRADGTSSAPQTISVTVVEAPPTLAPTPTLEPTPIPQETTEVPAAQPTATPAPTDTPTGPRGVTTMGVNVRGGPSTFYPIIGSLLANYETQLTGRNADNTWFRLPYGLSEGWVYGELMTITGDVSTLPVINVPPPPPTAVPQPTAVPATAVPAGPSIRFWSTYPGTPVSAGTVIRFYWEVSGVKAVYFQNNPATGSNSGGIEQTVNATTTFTLRVVLPDDSVREERITVEVK